MLLQSGVRDIAQTEIAQPISRFQGTTEVIAGLQAAARIAEDMVRVPPPTPPARPSDSVLIAM